MQIHTITLPWSIPKPNSWQTDWWANWNVCKVTNIDAVTSIFDIHVNEGPSYKESLLVLPNFYTGCSLFTFKFVPIKISMTYLFFFYYFLMLFSMEHENDVCFNIIKVNIKEIHSLYILYYIYYIV